MGIAATTFAPVMKFRFGASARDADGVSGTLSHVIVAAESRSVIAVGVHFGFGPFGHEVYAPVERVRAATDNGVEFNTSRAEIEKDGKQPVGVRLGSETPVTQSGKRLGKLVQVSFNAETRELRHLVLERGLGAEFVLSATAVSQIATGSVTLTAGSNGTRPTMTPFRPDEELAADALKAIESYPRLRVDQTGVNITAIDGVIWLRGHVSSEMNRRLISDLVSGVYGLADLRNELITDPELAAEISHKLSRDPRTTEERIGVYPMLGRVRLRGAVRTASAREAAEQLATATPGVGEIVNELHVDPNANVLPVMASVTNTEDDVPGGR